MEVDITYGSITVRLGGVASYCAPNGMVQPDNPSGVTVVSYTYAVPGTGYQTTNPIPVNDNVAITSTVAPGTVIPALHSLVVLFTRTTRPPGYVPGVSSGIDEALAIVVVPYGPIDDSMASVLVRPPAIGHPSDPTVAAIRAAPLVFDNATIGNLPEIIDLDTLPTTWGTFGNERPDIDDFLDRFGGFCGELWKGYGTASWTPMLQHPGYGRTMATQTSQGLLLAITTEDAAKRRELARRMTQWGVDLLGAFLSGRNDQVDGAHYQGRKALVVFSGHMLEAPWEDATAFLAGIGITGVFNEDEQFFTASPAWVWGWPYGYLGRTEFPTNLHDPIPSWNGNVVFYLKGYFEHVCGAQMGTALAMDLLGLRTEMGVGHYGMMAQWMEGPSAPDLAAMALRDPDFANIPWGESYSTIGGRDFARAAWVEYSDYVPGDPDPEAQPNIGVTGNGNAITNNDDTPSATDHTDFGAAGEGGLTISRTFTVANSGDKVLTIGSVTVPTGYTITTALPSTIDLASNAPLIVRLDTGTPGVKSGPVSIASDDPDTPKFEFFVTGTVNAEGGGPAPTPVVVTNAATVLAAQTYFRRF